MMPVRKKPPKFNFNMTKGPFSERDLETIRKAIGEAELQTSGEIRVHVEKRCPEDVMDRAAFVFEKLEMHRTALRSGVLFYLSYEDRKLAILGDAGINEKVEDGFWDQIKDRMVEKFKDRRFTEGLREGIAMAGDKLNAHFPYTDDDVDELSNEVSFGPNIE